MKLFYIINKNYRKLQAYRLIWQRKSVYGDSYCTYTSIEMPFSIGVNFERDSLKKRVPLHRYWCLFGSLG